MIPECWPAMFDLHPRPGQVQQFEATFKIVDPKIFQSSEPWRQMPLARWHWRHGIELFPPRIILWLQVGMEYSPNKNRVFFCEWELT